MEYENYKEQQRQTSYKMDFSWTLFLPIMLVLGVVPLLTRLTITQTPQVMYALIGNQSTSDFFHQIKSTTLILICGIILFIIFLTLDKAKIKWDNTMKIYYIAAGIFGLMILLSGMFSAYREISIWGRPDRGEGMLVLLGYLVLMFYSSYCINKEKDYAFIVWPLVFLTVIFGVLGWFQFLGKDFLMSETGLNLIVPAEHAELKDQIKSIFEAGRIYLTLYNPNYVGSFGAMMVPLFITLALFDKTLWKKIVFALTALIALAVTVGSKSSAGMLGISVACLVMVILYAKGILKAWKIAVPLVVLAVLAIFGINKATDGEIGRIVTKIQTNAQTLFEKNEDFDYKSQLYLRDVKIADGELILQVGDTPFYTSMRGDEVVGRDINGNVFTYTQGEDGYYRPPTEITDRISFELQDIENVGRYLVVRESGATCVAVQVENDRVVRFVNPYTVEEIEIIEAPSFGFKGKEKVGSNRGYIWSRSIPLLKKTIVLGTGADTYMVVFPQRDLLAKRYSLSSYSMVVDKPHNLYLQMGIENGIIALLAFLTLVGVYILTSFKNYALKKEYTSQMAWGAGILVAVIGYLVAGFFNDSVVSVAPIFWILLGVGIATNYLYAKKIK
jgi:hypothetical protein